MLIIPIPVYQKFHIKQTEKYYIFYYMYTPSISSADCTIFSSILQFIIAVAIHYCNPSYMLYKKGDSIHMVQGLSKKLTLLRQQNKLSQSEVARRIGVSSSAVSAYEADETSPTLENLIKLANLYSVSTDYLLGVSYPRDKAVLDTSGLNKQQLTVLQNLIDIMK